MFTRHQGTYLSSRRSPSNGISRCVVEPLESRRLLQGTGTQYTEVNLASNGTIPAAYTDSNLVNAWGLAAGPSGPFVTANNGSGTASFLDGHGAAQGSDITIPSALSNQTATPTGVVFNNTSGFSVSANGQTAPAQFIFVTEQGTIAAFAPSVNASSAATVVDNNGSGAVYKGVTIASTTNGQFVYAANFANNRIDVFDTNFAPATLSGGFSDPKLPKGYAPFGIANINGQIYVSYAQQNAARTDDVAGSGRGFVDVFNTDGTLARRLISRGQLNAPWGMTMAPSNFGFFSGTLLVGNFGNGRINAYNPSTGAFLGTLRDSSNRPLAISGLWGLSFGNDNGAGASNSLFFTAGPNGEQDGLFGLIGSNNPTNQTSGSGGGTTTGQQSTQNPAVPPNNAPLSQVTQTLNSGPATNAQTNLLTGNNSGLASASGVGLLSSGSSSGGLLG